MAGSLDGLWLAPARRAATQTNSRQRRRWLLWCVAVSLPAGLMLLLAVAWATPQLSWADRASLPVLIRPARYLVLFQNPRELRPTGGFLGSFAEVELGWFGTVRGITVETNIYQREQTVTSPPPAPPFLKEALGDQPWPMRESNWALDVRAAAGAIETFYQHSGGRPVDGVIFTDSRLLERFLSATGALEVVGYPEPFQADTIHAVLAQAIEKQYFTDPQHQLENEPKQVLADLLPVLLKQLVHVPLPTLRATLADALAQKELMLVLRQPGLAATAYRHNWDGHLDQGSTDYLYLNEANYAPIDPGNPMRGAKSAWSVNRRASLTIDTAGRHQLVLDRYHAGSAVWPDGPSHAFIRVALPAGATLLAARRGSTPITQEVVALPDAGKAVFGLWSRLEPGQTEQLSLTYTVPAGLTDGLVVQRQPGMPRYPWAITRGNQTLFAGDLVGDIRLPN